MELVRWKMKWANQGKADYSRKYDFSEILIFPRESADFGIKTERENRKLRLKSRQLIAFHLIDQMS